MRGTVRHRRAGATEAPAGRRVTARDARRANPAETRVARLGRRLRQEREEGGRPLHPRAGEEEIQAFGRARWRSRRSRRSWRAWRTRRPRRETRERRPGREQGARGRFEPGVGPSPPTGRFRSPRRARPRSAHLGCPRRRRFAVRFSAMPSLTDLSPLVPRLPQFAQAKNRIVSQMSVIRQQLSMIEAYDMDGWKGARYAVSRDLAFTTQRRSTRSYPRRGASSDEAFDFLFLFSFRLRVSVRRADETETHPFARPRTAAVRNSAPPLRSRRRARRSSTPSSASESCSRLWISRSRTRTPRRSLKNQPSTPTTKPPPPPPPPSTTRTRASTRRTFSAPPAARATRTTTTTSCCATGSARARTTCPAWTRR